MDPPSQPSLLAVGMPRYDYSRRYAPGMADFTKAFDSKTRAGKRCYRLNLERPFDIHCEQSPLEYGDYMAPWTKEVFPATVGPTEYCPPRHLGGEEVIWRELMRWSAAASRDAVTAEEGKVNSLDEVDAAAEDLGVLKINADGGGEEGVKSADSGVAGPGGEVHSEEEEKRGSADEVDLSQQGVGGSGWRKLSPAEAAAVEKLGDKSKLGEYTFETYDLSHVLLNTAKGVMRDENDNVVKDPGQRQQDGENLSTLRTVFSMDSTTSEDERVSPKTPEDMANDTARLFRRSELSLREAAERRDREEAERREKQRAEEIERQERRKEAMAAEPDLDGLSMSTRKRMSKRLSTGGKKLFRGVSKQLSSAMTELQGTPSSGNLDHSWRGGSHHRRQSSTSSSGRNSGLSKRSSMQALTIDKARDLVDESDDEDAAPAEGAGDDEANKKPLNVSLFILGEFDILNDLVNDGAKRLRDGKESSDLDILLQNEPCPPPNRWVRSTGWSKCNPSSMYARIPPKDFDWEMYYDKLRLKTGPGKTKGLPLKPDPVMGVKNKGTSSTQGTDRTEAVSSSNEGQPVPVPAPSAMARAPGPPAPTTPRTGNPSRSGKLDATGRSFSDASGAIRPRRVSIEDRSTSDAAANDALSKSARTRGHNRAQTFAAGDLLSQSARPARSSGFRTRAQSDASAVNSDSLVKSARTPRGRFQSDSSAASDNLSQSARTRRGLGKRMSSIFNKGK